MNISFNLSPSSAEELGAMLTTLKEHGITFCSVPSVTVSNSLLSAETPYENKWRSINPGKNAPKYNEGKKAIFPAKEDFFKSLLNEEEKETGDADPIPQADPSAIDEDDI